MSSQMIDINKIKFKETKEIDISKAYNFAVMAKYANDIETSSAILDVISIALNRAKKADRTIEK